MSSMRSASSKTTTDIFERSRSFLFYEVLGPAGRGHHDVRASPELRYLRSDAHSPIDGDAGVAGELGELG